MLQIFRYFSYSATCVNLMECIAWLCYQLNYIEAVVDKKLYILTFTLPTLLSLTVLGYCLTAQSIEALRQRLQGTSSSYARAQKITTQRTGAWVSPSDQFHILHLRYVQHESATTDVTAVRLQRQNRAAERVLFVARQQTKAACTNVHPVETGTAKWC